MCNSQYQTIHLKYWEEAEQKKSELRLAYHP